MDNPRRIERQEGVRKQAIGLGLFSIGLGLAELLFTKPIARSLGLRGDEGLVRLYGLREIANGVGLLTAEDPAPWLWGRVAGDGLDIATLLAALDDNPRKGGIALALGAVAGTTAMDVIAAQAASKASASAAKARAPDYGDRSGFPRGAEAMRGAALEDFVAPREYRIPEPMAPWEQPPQRPPSVH